MTPGEILNRLAIAGGTITPRQADGEWKLELRCPGGAPPPITPELLKECKAGLIEALQIHERMSRGMDMLRAMEVSGQVDTSKYARALRLFEELDARYTALCDGILTVGQKAQP